MTDQERQGDPGWTRIQNIKKGRDLPSWDNQKKDYTRPWTEEDLDMTKQFIIGLETELIDHDQIKCQIRRKRDWPVTEWDDDEYLDQNWPQPEAWLRMIRIWKRALWSKFLSVMSIELKKLTVGVTERVPHRKRHQRDLDPKSSGVDKDIVAWIFEAALVKAAHGHDLLKEGILWTSCKIRNVTMSSNGRTATIDAKVVFTFPCFLTHFAVGPWDTWIRGALWNMVDPRPGQGGSTGLPAPYSQPGKHSWNLTEDSVKLHLKDMFFAVQRERETRRWNRSYRQFWPQWTLSQRPWSKELPVALKYAQDKQTPRREAGLFQAWQDDPPADDRLEESRRNRIKEIDNWVGQLKQESESMQAQFIAVDDGDQDVRDLYDLSQRKTWSWITTLLSMKLSTKEQRPQLNYPNLTDLLANAMRDSDRLICAQQEDLRQKIAKRQEQA